LTLHFKNSIVAHATRISAPVLLRGLKCAAIGIANATEQLLRINEFSSVPFLKRIAVQKIAVVFDLSLLGMILKIYVRPQAVRAKERVEVFEVAAAFLTTGQSGFEARKTFAVRLAHHRRRVCEVVACDESVRPLAAIEINQIAEARVKGLESKAATAMIADAPERNISGSDDSGKMKAASEKPFSSKLRRVGFALGQKERLKPYARSFAAEKLFDRRLGGISQQAIRHGRELFTDANGEMNPVCAFYLCGRDIVNRCRAVAVDEDDSRGIGLQSQRMFGFYGKLAASDRAYLAVVEIRIEYDSFSGYEHTIPRLSDSVFSPIEKSLAF
jgi:hypothetical protein